MPCLGLSLGRQETVDPPLSPRLSLGHLRSGTTMLEFVTSGRSVAISSLAVWQESACASTAQRKVQVQSKHIWRVRFGTGCLNRKLLSGSLQKRKTTCIAGNS